MIAEGTQVQTLFTNTEADAAQRSDRRLAVNAVGQSFLAVFFLLTWHDVPLMLTFLLMALIQVLAGLALMSKRLLEPLGMSVYAAFGIVEIGRGRAAAGWFLCSVAIAIAALLLFAKRRRRPDGTLP